MKRIGLLFGVMLIAGSAVAQLSSLSFPVTVSPYISTTGLANIITKVGSDTLAVAAKTFGSVAVGQPVYGVGIPAGTVVKALLDADLDSAITITENVTQGGTKDVHFGYLSKNITYGTGDNMGLPFQVYNTGVPGNALLASVSIEDKDDILGDLDIVLFSAFSDTLGSDSVAVAWPAGQYSKIVGVVSLTTAKDFGGCRVLTLNNIGMVVPRTLLYARLVARSTIGPVLTVQPFTIKFGFIE